MPHALLVLTSELARIASLSPLRRRYARRRAGGGRGRSGSMSREATCVRRVVVWQNASRESVGSCDDEVRPVPREAWAPQRRGS